MFYKFIIILIICASFIGYTLGGNRLSKFNKDCSSLISRIFKRGFYISSDISVGVQTKVDDILYAYSNGLRVEVQSGYEMVSGEVTSVIEEGGLILLVIKSKTLGKRKLYLNESTKVKVITQEIFEKKLKKALDSLGGLENDNYNLARKFYINKEVVEVQSGYSSIKGKIIDIVVDDNSGVIFFVESKYHGIKSFYLMDQTIKINKIKV